MLTVLEVELLLEVLIRLRGVGELVSAALVAADAVPVAPVGGKHVIEVGRPELGDRLVDVQPEVVVLGLEELGADVVLVLREVEGLAPVVPLQGDLVEGLEEDLHLVLVAAVGVRPHLAIHHHGDVLPDLGDPHGELDVAEDELPTPGDVGLGELVVHHLGQLLYLLVASPPHEGGKEHRVVHEALAAAEVGLTCGEDLHAVEDGHLGLLCRASHAALVALPVGEEAVVEEVSEVPVLAEGAAPEVLKGVDVDVPLVVGRRDVRLHQEQVLLLAHHVGLLLVDRLRVGLEVSVLLRLEALPGVDLVGVIYRGPDPGEQIPVDGEHGLLLRPLEEDVVGHLPDHGTADELGLGELDPPLHLV